MTIRYISPFRGIANLCQLLLFVVLLSSQTTTGLSQTTGPETPAADETTPSEDVTSQVDPLLVDKLGSPRATMETFLKAFKPEGDEANAVLCLDLSEMSKESANAKGPDLASRLKQVIDRLVTIDYAFVPFDPDYKGTFSLKALAVITATEKSKEFTNDELDEIDRIKLCRSPEDRLWRFCAETVEQIDPLWQKWGDEEKVASLRDDADVETFSTWWAKRFPESMRSQEAGGVWFGLPTYLWITLVIIIAVGFVADFVTRTVLNQLTRTWLQFYHAKVDDAVCKKMWRPVGLLMQCLVWYWATRLAGFPIGFCEVLLVCLKFLTVITGIWTAFRIVDVVANYMSKRAAKTASKFDDLIVPLVSKIVKIIIALVGVIIFIDVFGDDWKTALGGLGIGGAAIAFASKDSIGNFFGSVTVLCDRPFEIGDWIVTEGAEGTVERVGIRSTRIRTFYNSQITLPNILLTTAVVDNMGRRQYRRIKTTLGLNYDTTPEQMDAFCEGVRELLRRHPYTRKDYYHVYFNEFGPSSLDVLLYCFLECPDWSIELRERHRLFADILRLAEELKVQFAFPTSTLHLFQEDNANRATAKISGPEQLGRELAAKITGPPLTGKNRPGPVEFPVHSEFIAPKRSSPERPIEGSDAAEFGD